MNLKREERNGNGPWYFTGRQWRAVLLVACVAAQAAWSVVLPRAAIAEDRQDLPPPPTKPHQQNRYDFMWRTPPLPHYIVAMSQDDSLCDSIAKAFNDASTPKGGPPGSLYKAPMFIKWEHNPNNLLPGLGGPEADGPSIDVATVDPFNEGQKHPVARVRLWDVRGASYAICEFSDANDLSRLGWKTVQDVLRDPKCERSFGIELYRDKAKDSIIVPTFSPADLNRIPRSKADRQDLEVPSLLSGRPEINFLIAGRNDEEFIVLRNPVTEVTLVSHYNGRTAQPKNICLIGPEVPIDIPIEGYHPGRSPGRQF